MQILFFVNYRCFTLLWSVKVSWPNDLRKQTTSYTKAKILQAFREEKQGRGWDWHSLNQDSSREGQTQPHQLALRTGSLVEKTAGGWGAQEENATETLGGKFELFSQKYPDEHLTVQMQ